MEYVDRCDKFHVGQEVELNGESVGRIKMIGVYEGPNADHSKAQWLCTDKRAFCNTELIWLKPVDNREK